MYLELLQNTGLSPNEAKIYRALLEIKKATIWDIARHAQIDRRNAYDSIQRLIKRGLAFEVLPKKSLTYSPVHPRKLEELIEERLEGLREVLPGLTQKFNKVSASQEVYLYRGVGGLKSYINLIIKEGKDIYGIGSKGTWFDKRIEGFAVRAGKKLEKLKIKTYPIYDASVRKHPEVMRILGKSYRFLPEKYATESSIDIFGDYVAVYSGVNIKGLDQDIVIFILKDKTLAQDYKRWWQFMWDHLPSDH